jgi:hypothetical protein
MFKVYSTPCKNCLLSENRIVSPKRAKQIIKECIEEQTHFICHKASMNDEDVCCKTFYDEIGYKINKLQIFQRIGAIEFVENKDDKKLAPYSQINPHGKI